MKDIGCRSMRGINENERYILDVDCRSLRSANKNLDTSILKISKSNP